ncbi:MAG TPA: HAMP domain-containing sensor histidine kinase, partial [Kofleriaceae bacterium]|nr:HAMP domain-containing sensor histidine kinase [Kofleriaceae bacterium]
ATLDELARTGTVRVVAESAAVRIAVQRYAIAIEQAAAHRADEIETGQLEQLVEGKLAPVRQQLRQAVQGLTFSERWRLHEISQRADHHVRAAGVVLVVGSGAGALIGIVLAVIVSRRLFGAYARGQEAQRSAEQAAAARKELLEMVSHDLRSPLQSITLGIEVMRGKHGDLPQLTTIAHATERVQTLVEDLLVASQAETRGLQLERTQLSARAVLDATEELFASRAAKAGVRIRIDTCDEDVISIDRDRILQVLSNLVGNALSFTPRDGEIVLAATRVANRIRFAVRDTGPGIPEAEQAHLFDAFEQGGAGRRGKRTRRGSVGLGLYIARNLVRAQGGRIGVDSTPGEGSTFWFELPLEERPPSA